MTEHGPAPGEIIGTGTALYRLAEPRLGDLVVVHKQGRFRRARLVKVHKKRAVVAWSTSTSEHREQPVSLLELYETDDGTLSGGELAGVIASRAGYGQRGGQYLALPACTCVIPVAEKGSTTCLTCGAEISR